MAGRDGGVKAMSVGEGGSRPTRVPPSRKVPVSEQVPRISWLAVRPGTEGEG
jgi:hypothetical protein